MHGTMHFALFIRDRLPVREYGRERFCGEGAQLLFAGSALHTDLGPEQAGSAVFGWLLAMLGQSVGFPVPEGGDGTMGDHADGRGGPRVDWRQCHDRVRRPDRTPRDGRRGCRRHERCSPPCARRGGPREADWMGVRMRPPSRPDDALRVRRQEVSGADEGVATRSFPPPQVSGEPS